jgi:large exoprotein involved in heme utilization and adhesion
VTLNAIEVDPSRDFVALPETPLDVSRQIVAGCPADRGATFVETGRGGLPEDPRQPLVGQVVVQDLRMEPEGATLAVSAKQPGAGVTAESGDALEDLTRQGTIAEAQSWRVNAKGQVELVARLPSENLGRHRAECGD